MVGFTSIEWGVVEAAAAIQGLSVDYHLARTVILSFVGPGECSFSGTVAVTITQHWQDQPTGAPYVGRTFPDDDSGELTQETGNAE
ncbi:MAG: hypothetical protein FWD55_01145 [Propionibacteriaceae bacterium]|nr:hypothetical protein [Propionibacteriaceae bacterium]